MRKLPEAVEKVAKVAKTCLNNDFSLSQNVSRITVSFYLAYFFVVKALASYRLVFLLRKHTKFFRFEM